jgi:hypothetical protein
MRLLLLLFLAPIIIPAQTPRGLQSQPEYGIPSDPDRDPWQKPDQVISALNFSGTETVAVIESGYPYFAQRIAPFVKKVYAINTDARAFQGRGALPPAIGTIVSTPDDPHMSTINVDTIMMVDVLRMIPQRLSYWMLLSTGLRSGGRLVVIDRNLPSVIPDRITDSILEAELPAVGFSVQAKFTFLPNQFFLVFKH